MVTRRYRVGLDIEKYAKMFIVAIIVSFVIGASISTVFSAITINEHYSGQIKELREKHAQEMLDLQMQHDAECSLLKMEVETAQAELAVAEAKLADREETLSTIEEIQAADFQLLQKYWYVLRDASPDSGLTLEVLRYADEQCQQWDVNPDWMWHVYQHETGWTTEIDNKQGSGARGLGQVMPATGKEMWERVLGHGEGTFSLDMLYDPYVNVEITVAIIGRNLDKNGSMRAALKLYSGGSSTYYDVIVGMAAEHGITLNEDCARYPKD